MDRMAEMTALSAKVAIVIVTHNSEKHIDKCLACVGEQTCPPSQVIVVDSGSADKGYLNKYLHRDRIQVVFGEDDIGFCRGNNLGLTKVNSDMDYLFFLNPDAFIAPDFLQQALAFMQAPQNAGCGAITGTTLGYCIQQDAPTGCYDTTGVFATWWGRWYDRAQGHKLDANQYQAIETIPAICGAVFFCRKTAADQVMLPEAELFDSRFYMYKEDIDLSLRLRRRGWQLKFLPALKAYHCRGWNRDRKSMPKKMRLYSAYNELRIHWRQKRAIPLAYSLLKYCAVKYLNV